jgi:hypothetical protein
MTRLGEMNAPAELGRRSSERVRQVQVTELGTRVIRSFVMENEGSRRRRVWWIASSAATAYVGSSRRAA